MGQLSCTIVITGELDKRYDAAFDGLALTTYDGVTRLTGALADQSQLQGVLRQLFDLGLDVVSFTASAAPEAVHPGEPPRG